jgi:hypothetical protein
MPWEMIQNSLLFAWSYPTKTQEEPTIIQRDYITVLSYIENQNKEPFQLHN